MKILSSVPAPPSVRLVKAILVAVGALAIVGTLTADQLSRPVQVLGVIFGLVCLVSGIRIKHGFGHRMEVTGLMVVLAGVMVVGLFVGTGPMGLFGFLIPIAVTAWANSGSAKKWFDSRR